MNLDDIFANIEQLSIAVIGDYCLDVYWIADMKRSVLSRETPHYPLPIVSERISAGGAGNVALNVAALKPRSIAALGVIGTDWRAELLRECLVDAKINVDGLIRAPKRVTNCYIKPIRHGYSDHDFEDPRIDFENYSNLDSENEQQLIKILKQGKYDMICVCDQMLYGCITEALRDTLCEMGSKGQRIIVDSRDRIKLYTNVIVKPNEIEAKNALSGSTDYEKTAGMLSEITHKPSIITLGENGCIVCEDGKVSRVNAFNVEPPIDICGAGDTFLAAFACSYAAGASLTQAACLANAASSITVGKVLTTGTASREEIESVLSRCGMGTAFF